jgi:hypothetical protein
MTQSKHLPRGIRRTLARALRDALGDDGDAHAPAPVAPCGPLHLDSVLAQRSACENRKDSASICASETHPRRENTRRARTEPSVFCERLQ